MKSRWSLLTSVAFVFLALAAVAHAENWPQWRGPKRDGISGETNLPAQWSLKKNLAWTAKLPGMGSSTPAIWKDRIFLTSEDGTDIVLLCLDTKGNQLWKTKLGSGKQRFMKGEANLASSSPSTDGKHIYAFIGTGDFACFDFAGKEVWKFNAYEDHVDLEESVYLAGPDGPRRTVQIVIYGRARKVMRVQWSFAQVPPGAVPARRDRSEEPQLPL